MEKAQVVLATLLAYKLILIGIGLWASKRTKDSDDFFLGGRSLGPFVAALSYSSSAASAWVLLGLTGIAYTYGLSTIWVALGSITSMLVVWFWIAPRLLSFSEQQRYLTLTEIVAHGSQGKLRRAIIWVSSLIIVSSFTLYIAAQFQGAGNTFASTFDISMTNSIIIGAVIIAVYTLLGGFWAVSVTDALQGSLMALTAIIMPVFAYTAVGGWDGLQAGLAVSGNDAQLSFTAANGALYAVGVVLGGLAIGFGTYGQPHLMVRIMALRDARAMRQARLITILWYLIVFLGMWFVGLVGHVLYGGLENAEQIFFVMLDGLFPTVVGAILLAAVLSAIMSTADSQLLAAAAAIANDLGIAKGGDRAQQHVLWVSRLTIVALVIAAVTVAVWLPEKIFSRVLFAWMALGAAFGPSLFAHLAGMQIKAQGVLASIICGFVLTVILSFLPNTPGDIAERLVPFIAASLVLVLFKDQQRGSKNA